jgi:hypothetical protein
MNPSDIVTIAQNVAGAVKALSSSFQKWKDLPAELSEFHSNMNYILQIAKEASESISPKQGYVKVLKDSYLELEQVAEFGVRLGQNILAAGEKNRGVEKFM